jgi:hypothetical protein
MQADLAGRRELDRAIHDNAPGMLLDVGSLPSGNAPTVEPGHGSSDRCWYLTLEGGNHFHRCSIHYGSSVRMDLTTAHGAFQFDCAGRKSVAGKWRVSNALSKNANFNQCSVLSRRLSTICRQRNLALCAW